MLGIHYVTRDTDAYAPTLGQQPLARCFSASGLPVCETQVCFFSLKDFLREILCACLEYIVYMLRHKG
jgi:hypothetical protein